MIKFSPLDKWVLTISAFLYVGAAMNYEDAQTQTFSYTPELKMWAGIISKNMPLAYILFMSILYIIFVNMQSDYMYT